MRQMRSRQQDQGEDRGEECITWWCLQERGPSLTTMVSVLLFYAKTVETESPWQWVLFYRCFCKWKSLCPIIFCNLRFVIALINFHVTFLPREKNENVDGCNLCRFYAFKNPQNRLLVIGKGRATRGFFFFFSFSKMKSPLLQTWIRQFRERDATGTAKFFTWIFINDNKIFMGPIWSWISLA